MPSNSQVRQRSFQTLNRSNTFTCVDLWRDGRGLTTLCTPSEEIDNLNFKAGSPVQRRSAMTVPCARIRSLFDQSSHCPDPTASRCSMQWGSSFLVLRVDLRSPIQEKIKDRLMPPLCGMVKWGLALTVSRLDVCSNCEKHLNNTKGSLTTVPRRHAQWRQSFGILDIHHCSFRQEQFDMFPLPPKCRLMQGRLTLSIPSINLCPRLELKRHGLAPGDNGPMKGSVAVGIRHVHLCARLKQALHSRWRYSGPVERVGSEVLSTAGVHIHTSFDQQTDEVWVMEE